jgi:hypothetical protein
MVFEMAPSCAVRMIVPVADVEIAALNCAWDVPAAIRTEVGTCTIALLLASATSFSVGVFEDNVTVHVTAEPGAGDVPAHVMDDNVAGVVRVSEADFVTPP